MATDTAMALGRFKDTAKVADLYDLAAFANVVPNTALGWLENGSPPKGEALLRVQHYLHALGYEIEDLRTLPAPAFKLGRMIAFGVIDIATAQSRLEYAVVQELYRLLRGASPTGARHQTLNAMIAESEHKLEVAVASFQERHRPDEPARLESTMSTPLSVKILSASLMAGVELLDNILDLVELQSDAEEDSSFLPVVDQARIARLMSRIQRHI